MCHFDEDTPQLKRVPGLYRRWEVAEMIQTGMDYRLEDAGATSDGSPLVAVFRGDPPEVPK